MGSLPPPLIGPTIATRIILNSKINEKFNLIHLDTSDHRNINTLGVVDLKNIYLAFKHYCVLCWLIINKWPDMVYIPVSQTTKGYLRDSVFILISKFFGRKVICHLRGGNFKNWYETTNSSTKWFVRKIHTLVDGQIVLGEKLINLFEGIISRENIFVVPNGRDFSFQNDKVEIFENEQNTRTIRILFLSNLIKEKGYKDVLYSVKEVAQYFMTVKYIFAGIWMSDKERIECDKYIKNEEIEEFIDFVGIVKGKDKRTLLQKADIFLFPTYYPPEGHPWVIVEAMAAGLPIISTDQGAITESIIDGVNGFIVEKQNPQQIAEKIKLLIENPEIRIKMGKESRRLYEEKFTEEKMVEGLTACFYKVLNEQ